jgi:hypothetical protein
LARTMAFNYTEAAHLWLKPLDLHTLSDDTFKMAYKQLRSDHMADPASEPIKAWMKTYKRESLRRRIIAASERIAGLERALDDRYLPYYAAASLEEQHNSEVIALTIVWGDLLSLGPETAEGAESEELQKKRIALMETEAKYIDTKAALTWRELSDGERDYNLERLEKYATKKTALIAEIKALL